jgi:hypothetical protein
MKRPFVCYSRPKEAAAPRVPHFAATSEMLWTRGNEERYKKKKKKVSKQNKS